MAKTGRPPKTIKMGDFEKLCKMQCTMSEVCSWFDVCKDTLQKFCKEQYEDTFSHVFKRFSETGRISLRRMMWLKARSKGGDTKMQIFLSKNHLGMSDKTTEQIDKTLTIKHEYAEKEKE